MRVLTFGTFDRLHPGHLAYLREAQARGALCVVVARDVSVAAIKGHPPVQNEQQRMEAVHAAFPDAVVVLGDTEDYLRPVRELAPDLIMLGYDQALPPGIREEDLPCPIERAKPYEPNRYKSSLMGDQGK